MAIKASLKKKWVKALRSGNYDQGQGQLKDGHGGYCCLGVLAAVADPDQKTWNNDHGYFAAKDDVDARADLQRKVVGGYLTPGTLDLLIEMNDRHGKNFKDIADYVERSKRI